MQYNFIICLVKILVVKKKNIEYQDYASACAEHMYVVLNLALPKRLSSSALLSEMC